MTPPNHRPVRPLTKEAFAAFGDVIEANPSVQHFPINYGLTERFHNLAAVDLSAENGQTGISIFRSSPQPWPITITRLERHPLSSQAFMPLGGEPYLVIVAPPADALNESDIQIFLASPHQGVNYHAGTWHHFSLALNQQSDFLVIDRIGQGHNCDETLLKHPFTLEAIEVFK